MKKKVLFMLVLCISLLYPKVCFAGTINGNEAELIAVAKGTFEYKGKTYVVSKGYIDSVIAYVKQEDVDITPEQKEEILNAVFGNLAQGIQDGYLIPLESENTADEDNTKENVDSETIGNEHQQDVNNNQTIDSNTQGHNGTTYQDGENIDTDNNSTSEVNDKNKEVDSHVEEIFNVISEELESKKEPQVLIDRMQGTLSVIDEDNTPILNTNIVIKNTGFHLYRTVYVAVGLGVIILVTFVVIFKYKLYAYDEQS